MRLAICVKPIACVHVHPGAGRTGEWWAVDHNNVVPDLLVFAKGIGSGMPISGVASRSELTATQVSGRLLLGFLDNQF